MEIGFFIGMFVLGTVMGSFLACQAWRLHYKDVGGKKLGQRSVCLSCNKQLKWYDNIPIFSWILLGGKCRYCKKKIGMMEILAELLMGLAFLGVALALNPFEMTLLGKMIFVLDLLLVTALGFLAIYDGMWGELPSFMLVIALVLAAGVAGCKIWLYGFSLPMLWNLLGAVAILGGIYLVLYLVSRGKWVGSGDWVLGLIIALSLSEAWLALIVLCLSNCLGLIIMYPTVRKKKNQKIYFGPFLVMAFVIVLVFAKVLNGLIFKQLMLK
ncbi:prepilin peptidase [Candidatus Saccharibacteria bacterium]|nr:prepilin peptidase [Candidatus Saccharibacteria bacterium]